jgi:hypothetical protein
MCDGFEISPVSGARETELVPSDTRAATLSEPAILFRGEDGDAPVTLFNSAAHGIAFGRPPFFPPTSTPRPRELRLQRRIQHPASARPTRFGYALMPVDMTRRITPLRTPSEKMSAHG